MSKISKHIYELFPPGAKRMLGKIKWLKPVRDLLFRQDGTFRELNVLVERSYGDSDLSFQFFASVQVAVKAQRRGMENSLLRVSLELLDKHYPKAKDVTIVDVGANFGYLSLVWAQTAARFGRVISFEPHSQIVGSLKKSIAANKLEGVMTVENSAVGFQNGSVRINRAYTSANMDTQGGTVDSREVSLNSLDDYFRDHQIDQCHLIKIDVDGRELDVLRGGEQLIKKLRPLLIVESNGDHRIIEFLTTLGYRVFDRHLEPWEPGKPLPPNAFAIFE